MGVLLDSTHSFVLLKNKVSTAAFSSFGVILKYFSLGNGSSFCNLVA